MNEFIFSGLPKQRFKKHLVFWIIFYVFVVLTYPPHGSFGPTNGIDFDGMYKYYKMVMIRAFFHMLCQMIFCYIFLYLLMPFFFWKKRYLQFACLCLLLLFGVSVFRYYVFLHVYNPLMHKLNFYKSSIEDTYMTKLSIIQNFDGPAFIGFIFISVKVFKDWWQKQRDNFNLQKENARAELQLLKAQIHPHFLFNTLNNIYSFTLSKSPQAKNIIKKLEDMLHYMIEECDRPYVPLENEIKIIEDYFELERIRYGNSFDMQFEVAGNYNNKMIAPLLMIPFVENSFKHGTSKMLNEPWIKLFVQADENLLHFSLINSKPFDEVKYANGGIGLTNIRKRLELLYPSAYLLTTESTANTFTVNMQVPLRQAN